MSKIDPDRFLTSEGISEDFVLIEVVSSKRLDKQFSAQNEIIGNQEVNQRIIEMFEKYHRMHLVVAGWIDQAVLEYHLQLVGDFRSITKCIDAMHNYRPDQNGDLCFYLADLLYKEVIANMVSFENGTIESTIYLRRQRAG